MIIKSWIKSVITIGSMIVVAVIKLFNPNYKDDNPIEEIAEQVIEEITDQDIDLTPESPEEK